MVDNRKVTSVLRAIVIFLLINVIVFATPLIDFIAPTLSNDTYTSNTSIQINVSIVEQNLSTLTYNWNGTNFTLYDDSLVLMMNFGNISSLGENSTYAVDMSRNAQNLSCANCPTLTSSGRYGKAYTFDGINDVFTNNFTNLNFAAGQPHSIELWILASSSLDGYFIALGTDPGSSGKYTEHMQTGADTTVVMDLRQTYQGDWVSVGSITPLSSGTWYHIAGVNDGSAIKIYLNGVLENTTDLGAFSGYPLTGNSVRIGSGDINWDSYFNGSIDEVRIWNRSLSAEEVYQLYVSNLN